MANNIAKMSEKQRQAQRMADMLDLLSREQGRRIIWEIMETCGMMSSNPHHDLAQMSRAEGKREIGVNLHDWVMEAAPASFLKMLQTRAQQMEKDNG